MARRKNQLVSEQMNPHQAPINDVTNFHQALTLFLRECKIRNLSEHTIQYYKNELKAMEKMLEQQNQPTDPAKVTRKMIRENVILYMMETLGRKETAINARLRAVRAFFHFLDKELIIFENPMNDIKLIRQKRNVIETFTAEQVKALLRQPDLSSFTGFRDYSILLLLLETGIRLKELCGICVDHVNLDDGYILITEGKGYKQRNVPIQSAMRQQLRKFITLRGELDTDILFVTIDNTPISNRQVQNLIAKYGRKAGIKNVRCSPHTFRHTFARMSVTNGADIFSLQAILGHTSMDMVRNYVNMFSQDVKKNHGKFSPLEGLL
jgi:integrase/recombinase XerD